MMNHPNRVSRTRRPLPARIVRAVKVVGLAIAVLGLSGTADAKVKKAVTKALNRHPFCVESGG